MSDAIDLRIADTLRRRREAAARRSDRMAELVTELTGCAPSSARYAVGELTDDGPIGRSGVGPVGDPLEQVARAMVTLGRPSPLREPVYLHAG